MGLNGVSRKMLLSSTETNGPGGLYVHCLDVAGSRWRRRTESHHSDSARLRIMRPGKLQRMRRRSIRPPTEDLEMGNDAPNVLRPQLRLLSQLAVHESLSGFPRHLLPSSLQLPSTVRLPMACGQTRTDFHVLIQRGIADGSGDWFPFGSTTAATAGPPHAASRNKAAIVNTTPPV